jgi:hypothetical protein
LDLFGNPIGFLTVFAVSRLEAAKHVFLSGCCSEIEVSEQLYYKKGPLEISQMFFNIFFNEIKTGDIYKRRGFFFPKQKLIRNAWVF